MCDLIIGPHFFENAEGFTETINGEKYRHMHSTFIGPVVIRLRNRHEQDRATYHTANETMDVLPSYSHLASKIIGPRCSRLLSLRIYKRNSLQQQVGELGRFEGQHKTRNQCHQSCDVTFRDEQCFCKSLFVYCCRRATPERYHLSQSVVNHQILIFDGLSYDLFQVFCYHL